MTWKDPKESLRLCRFDQNICTYCKSNSDDSLVKATKFMFLKWKWSAKTTLLSVEISWNTVGRRDMRRNFPCIQCRSYIIHSWTMLPFCSNTSAEEGRNSGKFPTPMHSALVVVIESISQQQRSFAYAAATGSLCTEYQHLKGIVKKIYRACLEQNHKLREEIVFGKAKATGLFEV